MFKKRIDTIEEFSSNVRMLAKISSYGYFIIFVIWPLFVATTLLIDDIFIWMHIALILGFSGFVLLLDKRIMKAKFNFWVDIEIYDPLENIVLWIDLGAIISVVLFWLSLPILLDYPFLEDWERFAVAFAVLVSFLPFIYFVIKHKKRKFKGERRRYVKGKRKEIEKTVIKALDSLNIKYNSVTEGSKWTKLIPSFHIEGYGISVKIYQIKYNEIAIAIKVEDPGDHPEARKIEKGIDTFLNIMSG